MQEELEEQLEKEKEEQAKREAEEKARREHEEYLKMKVTTISFIYNQPILFILFYL